MQKLPTVLILFVLCLSAAGQPAGNGRKPSFEFGFEQRVRNENWNNILDYGDSQDDEREQIRYRTRVWMKAPVSSSVDFFAGLNQETTQRMGKVNKFDEAMVESAYLDFKRLFVDGLALRVGRQNLMRGEGFLLFEGTPGDGSRSIYYNAADLSYTRKKSTIELIGILNPTYDRFFPRIHDQRRQLQEWNEQALGVYYTGADIKNTGIEAYYFYKKEVNDCRPASNPQFQPDRHVSTVGARVVREITPAWRATGEYAAQWGAQHPATTIRAWGGYGHLRRTFRRAWRPYLQAGYWGLSGDDPATTNRVEGWDPLFSRWPKWSELYIYSFMRERGASYWTNLGMWQGEMGFSPRKGFDCRFTYYHMNAFHPFRGDQRVFGDGTGRGDNVQARLDFVLSPNWRGHALYETQLPGSFYRERRNGYFLRFELTFLIRATPGAERVRHFLHGD
jgi:hypothetical protein